MTITQTGHPALADLESRAGASDQDRELWLAERLDGITATEVRDLYLLGVGYRAQLLKEKVQRIIQPPLNNKYIAWGNTREPIIAAWAGRFGIMPESRIFHASDNSRFLASPDGIGADFDGNLIVDEIKTSKSNIAPGTDAFDRKGYLLQMLWVMRVIGAKRCLYLWEQHDDDWQDRGGEHAEPLPLDNPGFEWIEYADHMGLTLELESIAVDFLAELDEAVRDAAEGVGPQIDEQMDTLAVNLLRYRDLEAEGKAAKEDTWKQMLDRASGCDAFSQESALARVTWSPGVTTESAVADPDAAKAAAPDLFAALEAAQAAWDEHQAKHTKTVSSTGKSTLTVTAVKQKETKK